MGPFLLVRVECPGGHTVAAIVEGGVFPYCGTCGARMRCPGTYAADHCGATLGYVAEMLSEREAVERCAGTPEDDWLSHMRPMYKPADLRAPVA